MNYEPGVGGAVFRHVQTAETCFFELSEPDVALYPWWLSKAAPETKLWGSEVPAQHRNGMFLPGSRSSLQSRRGRGITRDHRHMLHLFHSLLRSTFICLTYSLLGFSRGLFCCGLRNIFFVPPPVWNHFKCSQSLRIIRTCIMCWHCQMLYFIQPSVQNLWTISSQQQKKILL